jgi:hypothetical protein
MSQKCSKGTLSLLRFSSFVPSSYRNERYPPILLPRVTSSTFPCVFFATACYLLAYLPRKFISSTLHTTHPLMGPRMKNTPSHSETFSLPLPACERSRLPLLVHATRPCNFLSQPGSTNQPLVPTRSTDQPERKQDAPTHITHTKTPRSKKDLPPHSRYI